MQSASTFGAADNGATLRAGFGTISTAPIAVKCRETIATQRATAASSAMAIPARDTAAIAAAPNAVPSKSATTTRSGDHVMSPGTCNACMPIKCMAPTASPTTTPPS